MRRSLLVLLTVAVVWSAAGPALGHVTPSVVLVSDREAVAGLLAGARRFFVREVKLTPQQRQALQGAGWKADEDFYRFYVGRDDQGRLVGVMVFLTEYTIHGAVRVAVGLGPDGKVRGATVVELSEETYAWVKPLIDRDFTRDYIGLDSHGAFRLRETRGDNMVQFYGQIVASLIQRAALLYEVVLGPETKG